MGPSRNGAADAGTVWKQQAIAACLGLRFCKADLQSGI